MSAETLRIPRDGAWSENGDRVWLPYDIAETAGKVRYLAWAGRGLPVGFREMGAELTDLRVRICYVRYAPDFTNDEYPWKRATKDDSDAVRGWEVE